jgi:hemolysin III
MSTTGELETTAAVGVGIRPRLRGLIHRWAALLFLPAAVGLVAVGDTAGRRLALIVYGVGVASLLAVSAIYHSGRLSPRAGRLLKRIDHSTILFGTAGTYTAIVTLALRGTTRVVLLALVWAVAALGVTIRMIWLDAPYPLVAMVYLVVGWLAVADLPALLHGLTASELALVVIGGLAYTAGGVIYALHRPNPWPTLFGYHEVFHALVVVGVATHFAAIAMLVSSG